MLTDEELRQAKEKAEEEADRKAREKKGRSSPINYSKLDS
jgi:hypothetical protein